MSLTKVTSEQVKYVIIKSGFTSRLVHRFGFVKCDIVDNKLKPFCDKHVCGECFEVRRQNDEDLDPLFIYDKLLGSGIYASPLLDFEKYESDIFKMIQFAGDGIIVFENDKKEDFVQKTHSLEYYTCFSIFGTNFYFDNNEPFAIEYVINAES